MIHRDLSSLFKSKRDGYLERTRLLTNLLISRLNKLASLRDQEKSFFGASADGATGILQRTLSESSLTEMIVGSSVGSLVMRATKGGSVKSFEQQVVPWESDSASSSCRVCDAVFNFNYRKHHCRLCGLLVCSGCTSWLPFKLENLELIERTGQKYLYGVKSCSNCSFKVKRAWKLAAGLLLPENPGVDYLLDIDSRAKPLKQQISRILPQFNQLLWSIEQKRRESHAETFNGNLALASDSDFIYAQRYRKSLVSMFTTLDKLAKNLRQALGQDTALTQTCKRLYLAYHGNLLTFLQEHMFTLNFLPNPYSSRESTDVIQVVSFAQLTASNSSNRLVPLLTLPPLTKSALESKNAMQGLLNTMAALQAQFVELQKQEAEALRNRKLEDAATIRSAISHIQQEIGIISESLAKESN